MLPIRLDAPRASETPILALLMVVLTMVFFAQLGLSHRQGTDLVADGALIPAVLTESGGAFLDHSYRLVTAAFLHGGILHFLSNVWVLWLFGRSVEAALGSVRFGVLFLLTAALGNLVHLIVYPESWVPAVGASGAVAGLFGAFLRFYPWSRVLVVVPIVVVPIWFWVRSIWFVLFWFGLQVLQGTFALGDPLSGGGIAWWIHIGGFLAGLGLGKTLARNPPPTRPPDVSTRSSAGPWARRSGKWPWRRGDRGT
ncbi:MAG: rhomboid family intramembrane serine protease [Pseudomonadota bacterium]